MEPNNSVRESLWLFVFVLFLCDVLCTTVVQPDGNDLKSDNPKVKYSHGPVKGKWISTWGGKPVRAFLGMPYVKAPTGVRRFKNPEDIAHWTEEKDATQDGPQCPQLVKGEFLGKEDCLFINVFTPKDASPEHPLPVLFYIHGGHLTARSSNSADYGPELLFDHADIILVTFNYRLGVLGFLSTEDEEARGNFGFKDQVAALKWTRENIRYFGGDPEHVTLVGHSAGSCSVSYHLHSPMSKGLFQRAISISAAFDSFRPTPPGFARTNAENLAKYVQCPATSDTKLFMKCLRETKVEDIFGQMTKFKVWRNEPVAAFRPVLEVDGGVQNPAFITTESLKSKSTVPLMLGYVSEDGLVATGGLVGNTELIAEVNERFDKLVPVMLRYDQFKERNELTAAIKAFYLKGLEVNQTNFLQFTHMSGDVLYWRAMLEALELHEAPAYLYYYTHQGSLSVSEAIRTKKITGVAHGDELLLLFPARSQGEHRISEADKTVSDNFISLFTGFVELGEGFGKKTGIHWEKLDMKKMNYLHIGTNELKMKTHMLDDEGRTQFWKDWINRHPVMVV